MKKFLRRLIAGTNCILLANAYNKCGYGDRAYSLAHRGYRLLGINIVL